MKEKKIKVLKRDKNLEGHETPMTAIIESSLEYANHDSILNTHTTNPFLSVHTINKLLDIYEEKKQPLFSVNKFQSRFFDKNFKPMNHDINKLIQELPSNLDLVYLDPPYNQHPYGSNYFMLNVIANNQEPEKISKVSGIPADWNRSAYNSHDSAVNSMTSLIRQCLEKASYVLLSYNDEGIINSDDWETIFEPYNVEKKEIKYDTYKGSRNLKNRSNKVMEIMYLISK